VINGARRRHALQQCKVVLRHAACDVFWPPLMFWLGGRPHSYIGLRAFALAGCTTVLYEGKPIRTLDAGCLLAGLCQYGRQGIGFAAPTAFRAIRKEDPNASLAHAAEPVKLERLLPAGERLDPPTCFAWLRGALQAPDH